MNRRRWILLGAFNAASLSLSLWTGLNGSAMGVISVAVSGIGIGVCAVGYLYSK